MTSLFFICGVYFMKNLFYFFMVFLMLLFGLEKTVFADEVVRIEVGSSQPRVSQSELARRVFDLERAVYQLQNKVYNLESRPQRNEGKSHFFTCIVETPFDGAFSATRPTEMAARAKAIKECAKATKSMMYCDKVKCG